MTSKYLDAGNKLLERVRWLSKFFLYLAFILLCSGALFIAVFSVLKNVVFVLLGVQIAVLAFLPILGFLYCSFVMKEYRTALQEESSPEDAVSNIER